MKLAHFYAINRNFGDSGVANGIKTIILKSEEFIEFRNFNVESSKYTYRDRKKINSNFDGLILGGGGLLYNLPHKPSGFSFNMNFYNYKKIKIPKCFLGIGINAEFDSKDKWKITKNFKESVYKFCSETESVGVRDNESLDFLESINIKHAKLTPCPSMFQLKDFVAKQRNKTVAVNLTSRSTKLESLNTLLQIIKKYFAKIDLSIILVVHNPDEDQKCVELAIKNNIKFFVPSSPDHLMYFYKHQQYTVGMRGHSLFFSTGANVPTLAISYNKKCKAHMEMLELGNNVIGNNQITDKDLVIEKLDSIVRNKSSIEDHLKNKVEEYYKLDLDFTNDWLSKL